jgi:hypothetical protein
MNISREHVSQLIRQARNKGLDTKFGIIIPRMQKERTAGRFTVSNAIIEVYLKHNAGTDKANHLSAKAIAERVGAKAGRTPSTTQVEVTIYNYRKKMAAMEVEPSLAAKLFETAGLESSEQVVAWLNKRVSEMKKFGRLSRKQKKSARRAYNEKYDDLHVEFKGKKNKITQRLQEDMNKSIKPIWTNVDRMAKAFGYDHAKCLNPKWDRDRDTFTMRVSIECPYILAAAHDIVEERMKGENEYGVENVKISIPEVGTARGGYYVIYDFDISYMTDSGKRAKFSVYSVAANKKPFEAVKEAVADMKAKIATIERKNLRTLLTRAINKIKVPK